MISWIIENKEWLFSGIGLLFFSFIVGLLRSKNVVHYKANPIFEDVTEGLYFAYSSRESTEVKKVAKRFQAILKLMNEDRETSKHTIADLAEIMELEKISDLESIFEGRNEPSFSFIKHFSEIFGVSKEWLTKGRGSPYSNDLPFYSDPMDYLALIDELNPDSIYFIRENSVAAPAFILLKMSNLKFLIINRTWHISSVVGAGGQRQLLSFYNLIVELRDNRKLHTKCWGLTLNYREFRSLLEGEIFPGKYTDIGFHEDQWWDDLTDINHNYAAISKNYRKWYGESFISAQSIIKIGLNENLVK